MENFDLQCSSAPRTPMWWLAPPDGCGSPVSHAPDRSPSVVGDANAARRHRVGRHDPGDMTGTRTSPKRPAHDHSTSISAVGEDFGNPIQSGAPIPGKLLAANDLLAHLETPTATATPKPTASVRTKIQADDDTDAHPPDSEVMRLRRELQHLRKALSDTQEIETQLRERLAVSDMREQSATDQIRNAEVELERHRQQTAELQEACRDLQAMAEIQRSKREATLRRQRQRFARVRDDDEDRRRLEQREQRLTETLAEISFQRDQCLERADRFDTALRERTVREEHLDRHHRSEIATMNEKLRVNTLESDLRCKALQQTQSRLAQRNERLMDDLNEANLKLGRHRLSEQRAEAYRLLAGDTATQAEADRVRWEATLEQQSVLAEQQRLESLAKFRKLSLRLIRATEALNRRDAEIRCLTHQRDRSLRSHIKATERSVVAARKRRSIRLTARNGGLHGESCVAFVDADGRTAATESASLIQSTGFRGAVELSERTNGELAQYAIEHEPEFYIDVSLAVRDREQLHSLATLRRDRDLHQTSAGEWQTQLRDLRLRFELLGRAFGQTRLASGERRQAAQRSASQVRMLVKRLDQSRTQITRLLQMQQRENERWRSRANRWIAEKAALHQTLVEAEDRSARSQTELQQSLASCQDHIDQLSEIENRHGDEVRALNQKLLGLESEGIRFAEHLRMLRRLIRMGRRNAANHVARLEDEIARLKTRRAA